mmetsp:Transcript_123303/g.307964  ORF Transcript_123303/g.307964 Transcript_123303/m.307964 type:complete len:302 (-) Transcript_123303:1946-2851(-)
MPAAHRETHAARHPGEAVLLARVRGMGNEVLHVVQALLDRLHQALCVGIRNPSLFRELVYLHELHRHDDAHGDKTLHVLEAAWADVFQNLQAVLSLGDDVAQPLMQVRKSALQIRKLLDDLLVGLHEGPQDLDLRALLREGCGAEEAEVEVVPARCRSDILLDVEVLHQERLEGGVLRAAPHRHAPATGPAPAAARRAAVADAGGEGLQPHPEGTQRGGELLHIGPAVPQRCLGTLRPLVAAPPGHAQCDVRRVHLVVGAVHGVAHRIRQAQQRAAAQVAMLVHPLVLPGERVEKHLKHLV